MLRKTFSCLELCNRWNININDLTGIVRDKKLKALNHRYSLVSNNANGYYYEMLHVKGGGVLSSVPLAITDENGFYFNIDDVEAFERENGITAQPPATDPLRKENEKTILTTYENAFIHQGDAWKIWFNGKELDPIKNIHGLTYIANLLSKPDRIIHVTTLCDSIHSPNINQAMMGEVDLDKSLKRGNMSISTMQYDGLSIEAKKELKNKVAELKKTIKDQFLPESERQKAKQDYNDLVKTLSNQYGIRALSGRPPKKVNETVKKDMDRVLKALYRAYERIDKQSPELCEHLKKNINTGVEYVYRHSGTLWHISFSKSNKSKVKGL